MRAAGALLARRGALRVVLIVALVLNVFHPFFHSMEGGSVDAMLDTFDGWLMSLQHLWSEA